MNLDEALLNDETLLSFFPVVIKNVFSLFVLLHYGG